jgi:hypothetical protein
MHAVSHRKLWRFSCEILMQYTHAVAYREGGCVSAGEGTQRPEAERSLRAAAAAALTVAAGEETAAAAAAAAVTGVDEVARAATGCTATLCCRGVRAPRAG